MARTSKEIDVKIEVVIAVDVDIETLAQEMFGSFVQAIGLVEPRHWDEITPEQRRGWIAAAARSREIMLADIVLKSIS